MMKKDISENLKLCLAAMESYRTGSLTPILKEELKYRIQSRRLSEGKDEMIVKFNKTNTQNQVILLENIYHSSSFPLNYYLLYTHDSVSKLKIIR